MMTAQSSKIAVMAGTLSLRARGSHRQRGVPMLLWCALLAAGACSAPAKVRECTALVEVINKGVDKIDKTIGGGGDGAEVAQLRAVADAMDAIAHEAGQLKLNTPELVKHAKDYQNLAAEVAGAARDLATAVDQVDGEKKKAAQARIDVAVKREGPVVDAINQFCKTP